MCCEIGIALLNSKVFVAYFVYQQNFLALLQGIKAWNDLLCTRKRTGERVGKWIVYCSDSTHLSRPNCTSWRKQWRVRSKETQETTKTRKHAIESTKLSAKAIGMCGNLEAHIRRRFSLALSRFALLSPLLTPRWGERVRERHTLTVGRRWSLPFSLIPFTCSFRAVNRDSPGTK